jgi:hypothetical protein
VKPKNLVIVRAVREQGLTHAEAAARYGVSRQWVHALVRRYDAEPYSTLTDNGLVFTTRLARYKGARGGFEKLLTAHGITQKNGRPGHPQTQGKIERFHQTLKRWLAARPLPATIDELNSLLATFQTWYNTARPHGSLGRRTPQEAYTALPKATPTGPHHTEWRSRSDRVDKRGAISIRYAGRLRHLGVGRAHAGTPVLMLIHDRDVSVSDANTGEIISEHTIDPARDYQPRRH